MNPEGLGLNPEEPLDPESWRKDDVIQLIDCKVANARSGKRSKVSCNAILASSCAVLVPADNARPSICIFFISFLTSRMGSTWTLVASREQKCLPPSLSVLSTSFES
jgi:hypothetical protein